MTETKPHPFYSPALDGLRGLLVMYVFIYHALLNQSLKYSEGFQRFVELGFKAVYPFFVISGLIVASSFNAIPASGFKRTKIFLKRRFARIYPLYFIYCLIVWYVAEMTVPQFLLQASFLFGFVLWRDVYDPITWTLFAEEIFYLICVLVLPYLNFLRGVIFLIVALCIEIFWWMKGAEWGVPVENHFLQRGVPALLMYFAAGTCLFYAFKETPIWSNFRTQVRYALTAVVLYVSTSWFIFPQTSLMLCVSLGAVLLALSDIPGFRQIFHFEPLKWLGKRCYFIYLCHGILINMWEIHFLYRFPKGTGELLSYLIPLAITLVLAELSWRFFEGPIIRWAKDGDRAPESKNFRTT